MKFLTVAIFGSFATAFAVAFWFVWNNRASEKIVTAAVPIAVVAILGIFFAGWVFAGEDDYEATFPVCFLVDLRTKLQITTPGVFARGRFLGGMSRVSELKKARPELFPDDLNNFARNVHQHYLQRLFVDFLVMLYRGSWNARSLHFDFGTGGFGQYGPALDRETAASQVLKQKDLEQSLHGNWFAKLPEFPQPQISLPADSKLSVTPPAGGSDENSTSELKISNSFCTIKLSVQSVFPARNVGEYRRMAGLSDEEVRDFATILYVVRAKVSYNKLKSGHPDMKAHKAWSRQLGDELRKQFDEELIWARVKDEEVRSRHYPPEQFTSRGRVPPRSR